MLNRKKMIVKTTEKPNVIGCVDEYFDSKKEEAKKDFGLACDLYRSYVGSAETREERIRRIQRFRCG